MICEWADDSQRFILEYFDIIQNSPSEIYHYAIPFSPSSSWLHKYYSPELLQRVKVVKGLQVRWGICSRSVYFNDTPQALSCWKDLIAVGLSSGDIIILDAVTGVYMFVLSCHTDEVNSLTFSLDGTFLVSGSCDKTVNLWDIQTGGVIKTFYGHTGQVLSVSISQNCAVIASGSMDETIRLWNVQTGECCCVIDGHNDFPVWLRVFHQNYIKDFDDSLTIDGPVDFQRLPKVDLVLNSGACTFHGKLL